MPDMFDPCILHCDMDAFFASVEQRDRPALRGRPVVVGGHARRGVVAAASYEARRYGVRSAMPASRARRLCPDAIFVRPRHDHYREVSARIFEIFRAVSDRVEGLSLDEAFLDLGSLPIGEALARARAIKVRVSQQVGLTISVGVGTSKLVAKLASDYDKPDGLTVVSPDQVRAFLDPMPVRRMPGIGPESTARLNDAGIYTVGQLREAPLNWLQPILGQRAAAFRARAAGIDPRPVQAVRVRRSISQESTFDEDLHTFGTLASVIQTQAAACARRLAARDLYARSVHLKLRSAGFSTLTRSTVLGGFTRNERAIAAAALELARRWADFQPHLSVRLVGVGVSGLTQRPDPSALLL